MSDPTRIHFLKNYSKALLDGAAAVFVGAGLSRPSGFVDWRGLLRDVAEELELDIDKETDLIALAQYHVNKHGSRSHLNQLLIDEFTKDSSLTQNHRLLALLPLHTVWTTNYDDLLERAFDEIHKRVDAKRRKEDMGITVPRRTVTIYKMHGDKTMPDEAVLTKQDYETYDHHHKRAAFSTKLQGDLLEKTFLFLGFSFTDPNIDHILSRIRFLAGESERAHYCILKTIDPPISKAKRAVEEHAYKTRQLQHRIADLKRYHIEPIMIENYGEITQILGELNRRSHFRDVFVSGSADVYDPLEESRVTELCRLLGQKLIREGYNLVSGFGLGIGSTLVIGAAEALERNDEERLILRPFPQQAPPGMVLSNFWKTYREEMIGRAGACIFICGNKKDNATGTITTASGVLDEFHLARTLGRIIIPIGVSGHAARQAWDIMTADLDAYFPQGGVTTHFQTLGNPRKSNAQILDAVFAILKHTTK